MRKRFGEFELDENLRRLNRMGQRVRLTGQLLDLLCLLLNRPGDLVSREQIRQHLWPDSNVDFDHSLDVLINRLRTILGDTGKNPCFVETVPQRGYRFVAPVSSVGSQSDRQRAMASFPGLWKYVAIALLAGVTAILVAHTRYEKFIPPSQQVVPAGSSHEVK